MNRRSKNSKKKNPSNERLRATSLRVTDEISFIKAVNWSRLFSQLIGARFESGSGSEKKNRDDV